MDDPLSNTALKLLLAGLAAFALILVGAGAASALENRYLTEDEAKQEIFPEADSFERERHLLRDDAREAIKERYGVELRSHKATLHRAVAETGDGGERTLGYLQFDSEVGKHEPIDFAVGLTPEGEVHAVRVMVYREKIGSEVRRESWLEQFEGKSLEDEFSVGSGIRKISGATISSNSVTRGVRKALAIYQHLYLEQDEA